MLPLSFGFSAELAKEYFIFLGNPGSGKSTIVNTLIGQHVAEARVNPGAGLTLFSAKYELGGKYYVDTPGLDDPASRKQAAEQIELALKEDGRYHLIFVVTLEAGRVKASDIATVTAIMDAIENPKKTFSIIVNKVTVKEKAIFSDEKNLELVRQQLNSGAHKTKAENFYYIDADPILDADTTNTKFLTINEKARNFILLSEAIAIAKKDVHEIATNDFNDLKEKYEQQLKKEREEYEAKLKAAVQPVIHHHYNSGSSGGGGCVIF